MNEILEFNEFIYELQTILLRYTNGCYEDLLKK
jgi:hypothetical protein